MASHIPHRRLLTIWRVSLGLFTLIPAFLISLIFEIFSGVWLLLSAVWLLLFFVLYLWYLPALYSNRRFSLDSDNIIQSGGVIYRYTHSLPAQNIQYASIITSPFDRLFGLCSLAIVAPGGRMVIAGLGPDTAKELIDILTGYSNSELE